VNKLARLKISDWRLSVTCWLLNGGREKPVKAVVWLKKSLPELVAKLARRLAV